MYNIYITLRDYIIFDIARGEGDSIIEISASRCLEFGGDASIACVSLARTNIIRIELLFVKLCRPPVIFWGCVGGVAVAAALKIDPHVFFPLCVFVCVSVVSKKSA